MTFYISPPPQNPLARVLSAVVGVVLLAAAFMLGMVALAVIAGLGLLVWLGVWKRKVWIRRKVRAGAGPGDSQGRKSTDGTIETEYTVISRKQDP